MDTRKVATEYRMTQWAQVLQERQGSGQSIGDYCDTAGISRNTYFYWQRKLRAAALGELAAGNGNEPGSPIGWARLAGPRGTGAGAGVAIEVGGCRIIATEGTDPELLVKVCRALSSL